MTDTNTPQQPSPFAQPAPRERHMLDTFASKVFFSAVCFLSPAALAIVVADFWLRSKGDTPENLINPLYFIRQGMTGGNIATAWPLLLSVLPGALILFIIFREIKARLIMLALLLVAALMELVALAQLSAI